MKKRFKTIRIISIIVAVLYALFGFANLMGGASPDSRFYYIDNIVIKIFGVMLIIACAGLLFKNIIAARTMVVLCILYFIEEIVTRNYSLYSSTENIEAFISVILILAPPIIFFLLPSVKEYYLLRGKPELNEEEEASNEENAGLVHSGISIASFILGTAGIAVIILTFFISILNAANGSTSQGIITVRPLMFIMGLIYIAAFFSSIAGTGLGIAGLFQKNRRKALAVWGTVLNSLILCMFILLFIIVFKKMAGGTFPGTEQFFSA